MTPWSFSVGRLPSPRDVLACPGLGAAMLRHAVETAARAWRGEKMAAWISNIFYICASYGYLTIRITQTVFHPAANQRLRINHVGGGFHMIFRTASRTTSANRNPSPCARRATGLQRRLRSAVRRHGRQLPIPKRQRCLQGPDQAPADVVDADQRKRTTWPGTSRAGPSSRTAPRRHTRPWASTAAISATRPKMRVRPSTA